ncbi:MAG TPA: flagellar filament capping protein FliD [Bryobacteraceae bacterium]|nr:flagellar filament capping protein FliD [Bryobacteraceae bacterium]
MPLTPLAFTGISTFSEDFQTVLGRAVSIASLPLKRLQNEDADLLQKKQILGSLNSVVRDLGASVAALGALARNKAIAAYSSDVTKVTVVNTGSDSAAAYIISDITSIARAASETSQSGYADSGATPVSATGTVKLVVGSTIREITLTPATNNLAGLRDAINDLGLGVTASVLTTGTGANPNYLTVSADTVGATTLQLFDDPNRANSSLLTSVNQGSNAEFKLNGVPVSKAGNLINDVVSGATFTILDTTDPGETVTLSLATSRSQLQSAIQDFASKYNALVDELGGQVGPAAGLLSGDFIVREAQNDLRQLTSYQGSGSIRNLSDLGIQLGADGKITFDSAVFSALSDSQIASAFVFFGSDTTGFGALADKFTQITDPITGLSKLQQDSYDQADERIRRDIDDITDRINLLQARVSAQLQAADALQAKLTSQQTVLTAMLHALDVTTFGKKE